MCNCIEETNKLRAGHNTQLTCTLFSKPQRVAVSTDKLDIKKRGRAATMLASFCPFCGESYAKSAKATEQEQA